MLIGNKQILKLQEKKQVSTFVFPFIGNLQKRIDGICFFPTKQNYQNTCQHLYFSFLQIKQKRKMQVSIFSFSFFAATAR